MRVLRAEEIRRAVTMRDAVRAVEGAFAALARGAARLPEPVHLEIPESQGEVHVKGAHLEGAPFFVFKVATGFASNPARGLPTGHGVLWAFDAATGRLAACLLDEGWLTEVRTGAAGAVAAKYLARRRLRKLGLVGAGAQARFQVRALAEVRALPPIEVWSRTRERAEACARELAEVHGVEARAVATAEAAVREADLVVTVTPSRAPLVRAEWLSPGAHVTAVGSDSPEKQELEPAVLARADVLIADRLEQCLRLGEIHHAVASGAIATEDVDGELGDLVVGRLPGRTSDDEITVCDLTGVGVQDAAIAGLALERARALGLGAEWDPARG